MCDFLIGLFLEHLLKSESPLGSELIHLLGDLLGPLRDNLALNRENSPFLILDALISSDSGIGELSIACLEDLLVAPWENDESLDVVLESLDVLLEGLVGLIGPSGVDGDADRSGVLLVDSDGFDLLEGEASSLSDLA